MKFLLRSALLLCVALVATTTAYAQEQHNPGTGHGCMTYGEGPTVAESYCTYTAESDTQNVYAITPNSWAIWVVRQCVAYPQYCDLQIDSSSGCPVPVQPSQCPPILDKNGNPSIQGTTVFLVQYNGTPVPQPLQVHPFPGEEVTVFIGSGTVGFVSAGQDEAVSGMLPSPPALP